MAEFQSPGVRIRELRAGVPQIRGAATSVGGMAGRALRGPANKSIRITSTPQAQRIFGSFDANSYLMESIQYFFDNGGSELWVTRILGSSTGSQAKAAKTAKITGGGDDVMVVTAKGEGEDSNNYNVLFANENSKIASTIPTLVAGGSTSSIFVGTAIAAKIQPGDTVRFQDSDGPDDVRVVVAGVANGYLQLQAAVTIPVGGLAAATTAVTIETFSMTVLYAGAVVYGPQTGLRVSPLSKKNYFVTRINVDDDEIPVTVTDSAVTHGIAIDTRPVNTDTTNGDPLAGGAAYTTFADNDYIGSESSGTGIWAWEKVRRVRMLAIPGVTGSTAGAVSKALIQYAERRKDCIAVTAPAAGTTPAAAVTFKRDNVGSSSYGAMYYPWIKTLSPLTSQLTITPPDGFVMGCMARTDRTAGVANAPAGEVNGKLVGSNGVERQLSQADKDLLYPENINPIEDIEDVGQCIMGSRTLENGEFNQIHVRRTFIYFEQSLVVGTRFVIFMPNTPFTRSLAKRTVDGFFENEWRKTTGIVQGTLTGDTLEEAFGVQCDKDNNPDIIVKAQQMQMDVWVNIPQTTENLTINIMQNQRGTVAALAA